VGYDNYGNKLPEPSLSKVKELVKRLSAFTLVVKKTMRPAWNERLARFLETSGESRGREA